MTKLSNNLWNAVIQPVQFKSTAVFMTANFVKNSYYVTVATLE